MWYIGILCSFLGSLVVVATLPQLGVSVTVNVSLTVVPLPVVTVSPLSVSVQTGGAVVLTCSVQNLDPSNMAATLEWVKDRDVLLSQQRKFLCGNTVMYFIWE